MGNKMFLPQTKADQSHRQPSHFVTRVVQRRGVGGISRNCLRTKKVNNTASRIRNFYLSFRVTCIISIFNLVLTQRKEWYNGVPEKHMGLRLAKRKSKTANHNLQKFIILIWFFHSLYLPSGGLQTENQGKIRNKITNSRY